MILCVFQSTCFLYVCVPPLLAVVQLVSGFTETAVKTLCHFTNNDMEESSLTLHGCDCVIVLCVCVDVRVSVCVLHVIFAQESFC